MRRCFNGGNTLLIWYIQQLRPYACAYLYCNVYIVTHRLYIARPNGTSIKMNRHVYQSLVFMMHSWFRIYVGMFWHKMRLESYLLTSLYLIYIYFKHFLAASPTAVAQLEPHLGREGNVWSMLIMPPVERSSCFRESILGLETHRWPQVRPRQWVGCEREG